MTDTLYIVRSDSTGEQIFRTLYLDIAKKVAKGYMKGVKYTDSVTICVSY